MNRILIFGFVIMVGLCAMNAFAAPHNGDFHRLRQPDGTLVPVRVYGDEFYQRVESLDGYTLVRDGSSRVIVFAKRSSDGNSLVPTSIRYDGKNGARAAKQLGLEKSIKINRSARRTIAVANRKLLARGGVLRDHVPRGEVLGDIMGVTLLVDFSDEPAVVPMEHIEQLMNGENYSLYGNQGSVRQYYSDMSQGKLNYTSYVADYYRAEHPKTHYDVGDGNFDMGKAKWLVYEALHNLDEQGFDYSTLTIQDGNSITAINCLYAGYPTQGWSQGLWPHQGFFGSFFADDVQSGEYQITNIGDKLSIGTICHENGHMIGDYPDLYDYGGDSSGAGRYCLMSSQGSGINPIPINAYFRNYSGWEDAVDITDAVDGTIFSSLSGYQSSFVYRNVNDPKEFFYIESRAPSGRNNYLGAHGLLIWHVDEKKFDDGFGNTQNEMTSEDHFYVSVEQADGLFDLENQKNSGDPLDTFFKENVDEFSDATLPDAKWWDGSDSGLHVGNVSSVADTMMFTIGNAPLTTYSLGGTVRDIVDKQTRVLFDGVYSGSVPVEIDKSFAVDGLVSGSYTLRAKSHNYYSDPVEVTLPASPGAIELQIRMPGIEIDTTAIALTVPQNGTATAEITITNPEAGVLTYGTGVGSVGHDVVMNEFYTGFTEPPDGVELWNRGENVNLGGWQLIFRDNSGFHRVFTFPDDTIIKAGETLLATDDSRVGFDEDEVIFGFNLNWAFVDFPPFSVALVDGVGDGVDFFKSEGSVDLPPLGTAWLGPGVVVEGISNRRVRNDDYDNASDWYSGGGMTPNALNAGQQALPTPDDPAWISASPAAGTVDPGSEQTVTVTFDATDFEVGAVAEDVLFVHSNVPGGGPQLKIACEMTVEEGEEVDGGPDADADTDTDTDTDTESDSDTDSDTDTSTEFSPPAAEDDCGCRTAGDRPGVSFRLIRAIARVI